MENYPVYTNMDTWCYTNINNNQNINNEAYYFNQDVKPGNEVFNVTNRPMHIPTQTNSVESSHDWITLEEYGRIRSKLFIQLNIDNKKSDFIAVDGPMFRNLTFLEETFQISSSRPNCFQPSISVKFPSLMNTNESNMGLDDPKPKLANSVNAMQSKVTENGKKKEKRQKPKPKPRPSALSNRPPTSFIRFFMDNIDEISKGAPKDCKYNLSKEAGRRWRELPKDKKEIYNKKATEEFNKWKNEA